MNEDNKRTAVGFSVTLSSQLIGAALAVLTIEGAFVAFALGNRLVPIGFEIIAGAAAFFFIVSIIAAGKGITSARNSGFEGGWSLEKGKTQFNLQAYSCIFGLVLVFVTFMRSGEPRELVLESRIEMLEHQTLALRESITQSQSERNAMRTRIENLRKEHSSKLEKVMPRKRDHQ